MIYPHTQPYMALWPQSANRLAESLCVFMWRTFDIIIVNPLNHYITSCWIFNTTIAGKKRSISIYFSITLISFAFDVKRKIAFCLISRSGSKANRTSNVDGKYRIFIWDFFYIAYLFSADLFYIHYKLSHFIRSAKKVTFVWEKLFSVNNET